MGHRLAALVVFAASACAGASSPAVVEHQALREPAPQRAAGAKRVAEERSAAAAAGPYVLAEVTVTPALHPLASLRPAELDEFLRTSPERIGSASVGAPNRGSLLNGVEVEPSPFWSVVRPERSWATAETAGSIARAVNVVQRRFPGTPTLYIGDISRKRGGYLRPHRSHQSGRDADIGYYYRDGAAWYRRATAENLDCERTWALIEALIEAGDVEYIFIDRSVQSLLHEYAEDNGEDPAWLSVVFGNPRTAIVRHAGGHRTHLHVRFHNDVAERTGAMVERSAKRQRRI
jgi:penicillin-insensitive murein endopeptidase